MFLRSYIVEVTQTCAIHGRGMPRMGFSAADYGRQERARPVPASGCQKTVEKLLPSIRP